VTRSRALAVYLTLSVGALPLVPVTHAHFQSNGTGGVTTLLVHSHRESHRHGVAYRDHAQDGQVAIDHEDDEDVPRLDPIFSAVQHAHTLKSPVATVTP
jgi:hypothetical protein